MKSRLEFYHFDSKTLSDCGQVLEVEFSNTELDWQGVILEKGRSPHFYPNKVYTPYFYFALALDKELNWSAEKEGSLTSIKTVTDEIWINPPQTPFTHSIDEPCHFLILAIEEQVFLNACPFKLDGMKLQFLNNYNVSDDAIKGIMELFLVETQNKGRNGNLYLKHLLSLLSHHYIQHYSNYQDLNNAKLSSSKFDQTQLDKVEQYIEQHISHALSVDDLADLLNCSKFYFLREFKKLAGVTPYQYIMGKRIALAKEKLSSGETNLAAISQTLGFNDQSHFTRTFKAQCGVTPGAFLKQHI